MPKTNVFDTAASFVGISYLLLFLLELLVTLAPARSGAAMAQLVRRAAMSGTCSGRGGGHGVLGGPLEGLIGDLVPAILPDGVVSAVGELLVVGEGLQRKPLSLFG